MIIINGKGLIMGRLASFAASKAREGEKVVILNSEEVIITGKKEGIFERYKTLDEMKPRNKHGVTIPKIPDRFLRRVIRGMIGKRKSSGREAFRKVKCYVGVPEEFKNKEAKDYGIKSKKDIKIPDFVTVQQVCEHLGYSPKNRKR